jgi:diaminopimelate epimerase
MNIVDSTDSIPFTKMQALGNDFVVIDQKDIKNLALSLEKLAKLVCDRHFGIGADGLIIVQATNRSDCQLAWSYINNDGSFSNMCGNGIRCLALWAKEHNLTVNNKLNVETTHGKVEVLIENDNHITSDLGEPILESTAIPVSGKSRKVVLKEKILIDNKELIITCVSMGNPHCVIFNSNLSSDEQLAISPLIQQNDFFPEKVNVEFAQLIDAKNVNVFVYERGCGPTLACASGAAATLVAGVMAGLLDRQANIKLPGGTLSVNWLKTNNHVLITGPAKIVYQGALSKFALNGINGK